MVKFFQYVTWMIFSFKNYEYLLISLGFWMNVIIFASHDRYLELEDDIVALMKYSIVILIIVSSFQIFGYIVIKRIVIETYK